MLCPFLLVFLAPAFTQLCFDHPLLYAFPYAAGNSKGGLVAWNSAGNLLARSQELIQEVSVWDIDLGATVRVLNVSNTSVNSIAWIPNSNLLAIGDFSSGVIRIWNVSSDSISQEINYSLHSRNTYRLVLFSGGTFLASLSSYKEGTKYIYDNSILVWNTETWDFVRKITLSMPVNVMAFNGQEFAILVNNSIQIVDITGVLVKTLFDASCPYQSVSWGPSNRLAAACFGVGTVWDVNSELVVGSFRVISGGNVLFLEKHRVVTFGGPIYIYDTLAPKLERSLATDGGVCAFAALSSRGVLACVDAAPHYRLWDVNTGRTVVSFNRSNLQIACSAQGLLASGGYINGPIVHLWDINQRVEVGSFNASTFVQALEFSPDGNRLAVAGRGGTAPLNITVWDVNTLTVVLTLVAESDDLDNEKYIVAIAWHQLGGKIATLFYYQDWVCIFDAQTGLLTQRLLSIGYNTISAFSQTHELSWGVNGSQLVARNRIFNLATDNFTEIDFYLRQFWSSEGLLAIVGTHPSVTISIYSPDGVILYTINPAALLTLEWGFGGLLALGLPDSVQIHDVYSQTLVSAISNTNGAQQIKWYGNYLAVLSEGLLLSVIRFSAVKSLNFSTWADTITFKVNGYGLEETGVKWIQFVNKDGCLRVSLDANFSVQMPRSPGLYLASYRDRFSDDNPWHSFDPLVVDCPPGSQASDSSCEFCPPRTFQANESSSACASCPGVVTHNRTQCETCPEFSRVSENSSTCICSPNFYSIPKPGSGFACQICPLHAICEDGAVRAQNGYWRTEDSDLTFLRCVNSACQRGTCEDGYTGVLCGECIEGYGQNGFNVCQECGSGVTSAILAAVLIIVLVVVCAVLTYLSLHANPAEPNVGASIFKVGLSAAQLNSLLLRLQVEFPSWLASAVNILDGVSGSTALGFTTSCVFLSADVRREDVFFVYARMILFLPVCGLLCFWVVLFALHRVRVWNNPLITRDSEARVRQAFITGSATVLFTFHPTIVLATFRMFACRAVNAMETDSRLVSDLSAHCLDTQYLVHVCLVGIPMLLFYVIAPPLVAFIYMRRIPKDHILDRTRNLLLFLCMEYKPDHYWWFLVVILRKVIGVGIVAFSDGVPQLAFMVIMITCFSLAHLRSRPYSMPLEIVDVAETASLFTSCCVFSLAQLFLWEATADISRTAGVLMILFFVVFYVFLMFVVGKQCKSRSQRTKQEYPLT